MNAATGNLLSPVKGPRRLLLIHAFYRQPGGEDYCVERQKELFEASGWEVELHGLYASELMEKPWFSRSLSMLQSPYSLWERSRLQRLLRRQHFSIAHLHNLSPFLSSSVLDALPSSLARVRTLHNYRQLCINGLFLRSGRDCEACASGRLLPGLLNRCHDGSLVSSMAYTAARAFGLARAASVDLYVCPSRFMQQKHAQHGFCPERLRHAPYGVPEPARLSSLEGPGLFSARFSEEKGCRDLLAALRYDEGLCLDLAGQGPLEGLLRAGLADRKNCVLRGWLDQEQLAVQMASASYAVLPATWMENQPLALLQALAAGLPLIVSRVGGLPELVVDGDNGFVVPPGDARALASAMRRMQDMPEGERARMGSASRRLYETNFRSEQHLASLEKIFSEAIYLRDLP